VTTATRSGRAWTLGLANVHLENRAGRRRWWVRSGAARTRQARALVGALPVSGPLVLGGDLNTWLGAEAALRVIGSSLGDRTLGTRPAGEPRLDFLFARLPEGWRLTTSTARDPYGSDHRPVVGLIDVGE
jgi:endonuclease/exonuclease/phosphatase (EEP) superfamily protein YafD